MCVFSGYDRKTLLSMSSKRTLPYYKLGGKVLYKRSEIIDHMKKYSSSREVEQVFDTSDISKIFNRL